MGSLSPFHWIVVILVILLFFGPAKLSGVGKGLGEGIRNFKKGLTGGDDPEPKDGEGKTAELSPKPDVKPEGKSS